MIVAGMVVLLHRRRRTAAFLLPLFRVKLNEVKSTEALTPRVQRGWTAHSANDRFAPIVLKKSAAQQFGM